MKLFKYDNKFFFLHPSLFWLAIGNLKHFAAEQQPRKRRMGSDESDERKMGIINGDWVWQIVAIRIFLIFPFPIVLPVSVLVCPQHRLLGDGDEICWINIILNFSISSGLRSCLSLMYDNRQQRDDERNNHVNWKCENVWFIQSGSLKWWFMLERDFFG